MDDEFDGMETYYVTVTFTMPVLSRDWDEAEESARTHIREWLDDSGADVDAEATGRV